MMQIAFILSIAVALGYLALRFWRWRNGQDSTGKGKGFRPRIGFTRLDGMASLSLLLANGSGDDIWVEEIEIYLSDLVANDQTVEPTFHEIQKIRQVVGPRDTLPISLAHVIYKAAGNPQRRYSYIFSSLLRYRIGEEWSERVMENYRIRMAGLIAIGINRERKPVPPIPAQKKMGTPIS
jgi:hypothetical protein